jgi:23S rRNA (uracil1939-C5)-methyltransferase
MKEESVEIVVSELAAGGEGVGVIERGGERRAVFVRGVAPGERVRVSADFAKRPARGRVLELLAPSPSRVDPPCTWWEACGACDWMHLGRETQILAHRDIVKRAMPERFAGTEPTTHTLPRALGYRVRTRLHVEARGKKVAVGMFGRRSHEPVAVGTCIVLDPALERARLALATLLEGARGKGEASISLGRPDASPRLAVIDLRWSGELPAEVFARLERAVLEKELAGARVFAGEVKKPAIIGEAAPWIAGADGAPLRLAPGGFSQASEEGNALLAKRASELATALAPPGSAIVELYAGAGNLTVLFAKNHEVVAVEQDRDACEAARANLAARGLSARVVESDAASYAIGAKTRLVVLDPPRTGAKDVARALVDKPVAAILYVSCDPATLGRDLAILSAGYDLAALETFEMFPQTSHVETIATLTRRRGKS